MIFTDVLETVFLARGVTSLLGAFSQVGNAQDSLRRAQIAYNAASTVQGVQNAYLQMASARRSLAQANVSAAVTEFTMTTALIGLAEKAVEAYSSWATQVMNLRDLAGVTSREAVSGMTFFRAAGVSDPQAMRDILRLSRDVFQGQGKGALAQLGITASPAQSGLQLFTQIADRLNEMPNSLRKSQIETQLFGIRGVTALQPLLRLTEAQRNEIMALADSMDSSGLAAVQQFQVSLSILGQTILGKIVFPLASMLLPLMQTGIDTIKGFVTWLGALNDKSNGLLAAVALFAGITAAIFTAVSGVRLLIAAYSALLPILKANAAIQAFITALQGPTGVAKVAIAAAITGGVVAGAAYYFNREAADHQPADKIDAAGDKMLQAAGMMIDTFQQGKGRAIPGALSQTDLGYLQRQMALDAIG